MTISKKTLENPDFPPWLHELTTLGYNEGVALDVAQGELIELYFLRGRTPANALEDLKKVLVRLKAINAQKL